MGYFKLKLGYTVLLIYAVLNIPEILAQEIPEITKLSEVNGDFQKINGLWQEKQGDLWVASETQVEKYNPRGSMVFDKFKGLPENTGRINTIFIDSKENVYVGTENGLLKYYPNQNGFFAIPSERPATNTNIQQITEDNKGVIWMGASNGIWNYSGKQIELVSFFPSNQSVNELLYANDHIVFGTSTGLFTLKPGERDYKKINFLNQKNLNIQSLVFSGDSYLIGTKENGLFKTSLNFTSIENINRLPVSSQGLPIAGLATDKAGYVYVATTGDGLLLLDPNLKLVSHLTQQENNSLSLSDNELTGIFLSNDNTLWVYSETGLVNSLNIKEKNFEFIRHDPNKYSSLADNYTTAIEEDTNGNLWIGNRQGISIFHPGENTWQHIKSLSFTKPATVPDVIKDLKAHGEHMWVGTYNDGIYKVNINTLLRAHYSTDSKTKIPLQKVKALLVDSRKDIWAGGEEGNLTRISSGELIKTFALKDIDALVELASGDLIAAGKEGVFKILKNSNEIKTVTSLLPNAEQLPYFTVNSISETPSGDIVLATEGAGIVIYNPKKDSFQVINKTKGLPSNRIQGLIVEDKEIWAGTSKGLVNFKLQKDPVIRVFDKDDGLLSAVFIRGSFARLEQKLAFGTFKGISVFTPQKLRSLPENVPAVGLGAVRLHSENKGLQFVEFVPGEELSFSHDQNALSFSFSGTSTAKEDDLQFSYMLEGLDSNWSPPGPQREVSYANLGAGDYTFLVKARSSAGIWSPVQQVALNIQSPWWFSTGAYIGYGLLAILLFFAVPVMSFRKSQRKKAASLPSSEQEILTEETRTSLMAALASLEDLSEGNKEKTKMHLKQVTVRLKTLLRPVLYAEHAFVKPYRNPVVTKISMPEFLENLLSELSPALEQKQLKVIVNDQWIQEFFYYDEAYLYKLIFNVLSRSIKYSFVNGKIIVNLIQTNQGDLKLQITDNGAGLPLQDQEKIRENYHTSYKNTSRAEEHEPGLLNVRDYLEELGGSIGFKSSKDKGTTFTLILTNAVKKIAGTQAIIPAENINEKARAPYNINMPEPVEQNPLPLSVLKKILVAEDNDELRKVFADTLKSLGEIVEAKNGTEAFDAAAAWRPDVIIADFEMPGMNGVELSMALNKEAALAQIPLYLMLTQQDKINLPQYSNIRIFNFVTKPVNLNALYQSIKTELETPATQSYGNPNLSERNSQLLKENSEEDFFIKLKEIILENLSNTAFSVEDLSKAAGVSVASLSLRTKIFLGIDPRDFILHTRLEYAKLLLKKGKSDLSEVARQAGFPTKEVFFSSYKKHFGFMPGTIIEK